MYLWTLTRDLVLFFQVANVLRQISPNNWSVGNTSGVHSLRKFLCKIYTHLCKFIRWLASVMTDSIKGILHFLNQIYVFQNICECTISMIKKRGQLFPYLGNWRLFLSFQHSQIFYIAIYWSTIASFWSFKSIFHSTVNLFGYFAIHAFPHIIIG